MTSWFTSLTESVSTAVAAVVDVDFTVPSEVNTDDNDVTTTEQSKGNVTVSKDDGTTTKPAVSSSSSSLFERLTLTSTELVAERSRIDNEEIRKELLRNLLSSKLPWETSDVERDILVDECKDSILQLSTNVETFFGPFTVPPMSIKTIKSNRTTTTTTASTNPNKHSRYEEDDEDDHDVVEFTTQDEAKEQVRAFQDTTSTSTSIVQEDGTATGEGEDTTVEPKAAAEFNYLPTQKSIDMLVKLQPLPTLLDQFDLSMHVGLIEQLLRIDSTLVKMQATYSGGGQREVIFWNNYFLHVANARYEAGLSIDEIWPTNTNDLLASSSAQNGGAGGGASSLFSSVFSSLDAVVATAVESSAGVMASVLDSVATSDDDDDEYYDDDKDTANGNNVDTSNNNKNEVSTTTHSSGTDINKTPASSTTDSSEYELVEKHQHQQTGTSTTSTTPATVQLTAPTTSGISTTTATTDGTVPETFANTMTTTTTNDGINIDDNDDDDDDFELNQVEDYELDELEAEIARELEDD